MESPLAEGKGLLKRENKTEGNATWSQTLCNIVVSIVGTGVLGLPYAFRVSGWAAGSLGIAISGIATCYCMLLLIQCRDKVEEDDTECLIHIQSYGDLGDRAFGTKGRHFTELLVLVAQASAAIAYLVFMGQNLSSIFSSTPTDHSTYIFLLLLPIEIILSFIRSLSSLAPFSAFADVCNVLAMAIVLKEEFTNFNSFFKERRAFNGAFGMPFAAGIAVFCFEGFSMTLALEASMAERGKFRRVLSVAFLGITVTYIWFGLFGYLAYGDETKDIITLNLPDNWAAKAVKVGLCTALAFTFPIMMHPIHDITESRLKSSILFHNICQNSRGLEAFGIHAARILMVVLMATIASFIPGFGSYISLVGSTLCALLSFVLPATFHLTLMGSRLKSWQRYLDYCILFIGVIFAGYGTYNAVSASGHSKSS